MKRLQQTNNRKRIVIVLLILAIQSVGLVAIFTEAGRQAERFHSRIIASQVEGTARSLHLYFSTLIGRIAARSEDYDIGSESNPAIIDDTNGILLRGDPFVLARFQRDTDGEISLLADDTQSPYCDDLATAVESAGFLWDETFHFSIPIVGPTEQCGVLAVQVNDGGYIGVLVDLRRVFQTYLGTMQIGETGSPWVVDPDGVVLFDIESEIIGSSIFELHAESPSLLAIDQRMLDEYSGTGSYTFLQRGTGNEREKFVAWEQMTIGDQELVVAISAVADEVTGGLGRLLLQVVGMVVLSILVLSVYTYRSIRAEHRQLAEEGERLHALVEKRSQELTGQNARYRTLFETANDAVIVAEFDSGQIVDVNTAATTLLQRRRDEIIGMHQTELHPPEELAASGSDFRDTRHAPEGRRIVQGFHVITAMGEKIPVEISTSVVEIDGIQYAYGIFRDISERNRIQEELRRLADERSQLLKEVLHRTKNNIALVGSLLSMQSATTENPDAEEALRVAYSRVQTLADLQETLSHSNNVNAVQLDSYLSDLATRLVATYNTGSLSVTTDIDVVALSVPVKTGVNIGLIVNELITNSMKYAFRRSDSPSQSTDTLQGSTPSVGSTPSPGSTASLGATASPTSTDNRGSVVSLRIDLQSVKTARLTVGDNGCGMDISTEKLKHFHGAGNSLGLTLVRTIGEQVGAEITVQSDTSGTRWTITFPTD